jgi:hypothetical protein
MKVSSFSAVGGSDALTSLDLYSRLSHQTEASHIPQLITSYVNFNPNRVRSQELQCRYVSFVAKPVGLSGNAYHPESFSGFTVAHIIPG